MTATVIFGLWFLSFHWPFKRNFSFWGLSHDFISALCTSPNWPCPIFSMQIISSGRISQWSTKQASFLEKKWWEAKSRFNVYRFEANLTFYFRSFSCFEMLFNELCLCSTLVVGYICTYSTSHSFFTSYRLLLISLLYCMKFNEILHNECRVLFRNGSAFIWTLF